MGENAALVSKRKSVCPYSNRRFEKSRVRRNAVPARTKKPGAGLVAAAEQRSAVQRTGLAAMGEKAALVST
jgi:hypothetical protein